MTTPEQEYTIKLNSPENGATMLRAMQDRLTILNEQRDRLEGLIADTLTVTQQVGRMNLDIARGGNAIWGSVILYPDNSVVSNEVAIDAAGNTRNHYNYLPANLDPSVTIAHRDRDLEEPDFSEADCFILEAAYQYGALYGGNDDHQTVVMSRLDFITFVKLYRDGKPSE